MPTLISTSTAATPIGYGHQGHAFRVPSGPFAGRMIAIYARTPNVIAWSRADAPYTEWAGPFDIITDASDDPWSALMDAGGSLYVVYTDTTSGALRCLKLVYAGGTWGKLTPVTVYDSVTSSNRDPSLLKDAYDRIRIAWTRVDSGVYSLRTKLSTDDGATFGTGASDAGLELDTGSSSLNSQLVARSNYVHCVYSRDGASLKHRRIHLDAALWESAETLYSGTVLPHDFHVALAADNTLGVVFATNDHVYLKEFDGIVWGALQSVAGFSAASPNLTYVDATPFVQLLGSIGAGQEHIAVTNRVDGQFPAPTRVLSSDAAFDSVLCYDADAGAPYADNTAAAADATPGDVRHPESGTLIQGAGDALYLGMDNRFEAVRVVLATPGTSGNVLWEYWDGAAWTSFTPVGGAASFDAVTSVIRLFAATGAIPVDWSKNYVNGLHRFWIRAVVGTPYTTAPVGSQITAAADITQISPSLDP